MEIHVTEAECIEKSESVNKDIEHKNKDECDQCGKWIDCRTSQRKHMKKEHGTTSEQDIKKEEDKKESNEEKGKSEAGIMNCDLSNQPNRTADSRKWDPDDGICSSVQLRNVELKKKWSLSMPNQQ